MRRAALVSFSSGLIGLFFVACGGGDGDSGAVSCADGGVCPSGYACNAQGVCVAQGSGGSPFGGAGGTAGSSGVGGAGGVGGGSGGSGGSQCGNGVPEPGEECDTAGLSATCDADCTAASCGDGTVNAAAAEDCDDAGESSVCDADCTPRQCGDGTLNQTGGEDCDDGGETASCDDDCTLANCGDSKVNATAGEQCDTGSDSSSCDGDCTTATCGDQYVNAAKGEDCDVGGQQTSGCDTNCTYAICGDGTTNSSAAEQCDDNNTTPGDGCSATCTIEPPVGDTCSNPIALSLGANNVNWIAIGKEYVPLSPSCTSGYSTTGPDVVLSYQATFTGTLNFTINKPSFTRWVAFADDGSCGSVSSPLACVSDYSSTSMTGSISVTSGSTYWFYVADTSNGTNPLSKPFTITLVDAGPPGPGEDCSNPIVLTSGSNSVSWTAILNNYIPSPPACTSTPISGPDVVLAYTAPTTTTVTYTINKPTSTRWVAMASSVCGNLSSYLTCTSDYSSSTMSGSFSANAGSTYYIHVADTTSGTNPLSNPFTITISP